MKLKMATEIVETEMGEDYVVVFDTNDGVEQPWSIHFQDALTGGIGNGYYGDDFIDLLCFARREEGIFPLRKKSTSALRRRSSGRKG